MRTIFLRGTSHSKFIPWWDGGRKSNKNIQRGCAGDGWVIIQKKHSFRLPKIPVGVDLSEWTSSMTPCLIHHLFRRSQMKSGCCQFESLVEGLQSQQKSH